MENQPIFKEDIGYFCEIKTINFSFLLTNYNTYSNLIKKNIEFNTISNQKK